MLVAQLAEFAIQQNFNCYLVNRCPDFRLKIFVWLLCVGVEEIVRCGAVLVEIFRSNFLKGPKEGILYAVSASLGMVGWENMNYFFFIFPSYPVLSTSSPFIQYAAKTGILATIVGPINRLGLPLVAHVTFGVVLGYFLGIAKAEKDRRFFWITVGMSVSFLMHFVYNFLDEIIKKLFFNLSDLISGGVQSIVKLAVFAIEVYIAFQLIKKAKTKETLP